VRVAAFLLLLTIPVLAGACGATDRTSARETAPTKRGLHTARPATPVCSTAVTRLGSARGAYVGFAPRGATAFRAPDGVVVARFGSKNVNGYPTVFGIVGVVRSRGCAQRWYRVQLPLHPNGITGYVRASALQVARVESRIAVDLSARRLTLYQNGRVRLVATVAVGSAATPTPTGTFYVNQRLVPTDPNGPFGPGAVGISAFSNVLTGWVQGGPIAIHGTNEPWSIGHAVSNGCIRLPNAVLRTVFRLAVAGTPVVIRA
jgi:lipoprotein-anchoring transpeptidase ErfK/SrfK